MHHHLAVLDEDGIIISVNEAWRKFAEANGLSWDDYGVGRSYLKVCEFAEGYPWGYDKSPKRMVVGICVP